jgi:hypothetical protein
MIDTGTLKKLNLPAMGQLGIVVEDIQQSIEHYSNLLNISTWYRAKIIKSHIHYRDNPIDLELDIVVGYSGALQFELIQVLKGETNIYTDLINTQRQGVHHIGFVVSNITHKIGVLKNAGFDLVQHGTFETKGRAITRFAYFDTADQFGYITELIQTTLLGINVGMSRWMMKIGRAKGDVRVIKGKK